MSNTEDIEMFGRMILALDILESSQEFARMIPEVRSNMVYAKADARSPDEVLAIDGRITVVSGMPRASGRPRYGVSSHMARLLLELRKVDPSVRAGIDFANTPELSDWLAAYCARKGWAFAMINRADEPEDVRVQEGASMPWKAAAVIRAAGGKVPKIFYENGAVGKEPVSVIVGPEPISIARELTEIAREYKGTIR